MSPKIDEWGSLELSQECAVGAKGDWPICLSALEAELLSLPIKRTRVDAESLGGGIKT